MENSVGPGAVEEAQVAPKPLLEGANEYEYVELLNPLTADFIGIFAMTRPVRASITISNSPDAPGATQNESDVRQNYGLNLNNPDFTGKSNIQSRIKIPAGQTVRMPGNEAQVIIRQLVNEIMGREGKKLMMADPYQRSLVENRIVIHRGTMAEILDRPQTVQEQFKTAIDNSNQEEEFAGLGENDAQAQPAGTGSATTVEPSPSAGDETEQPERRNQGRPKKAQ